MRLDAPQVAAEPLERRVAGPQPVGSLVPVARDRPRRGAFVSPRRAGEAVREHLVHDAVRVPVRPVVADGGDEVVGVRDVVPDEPAPVTQP